MPPKARAAAKPRAAKAASGAKSTGKTETIPAKGGKPAIKFQKGGLHASTGTPQGKPIPASKKAAALSGKLGPKAQRQAQFAKNVLTGGRGK